MTKETYLKSVRVRLKKLPQEEIDDAVQYLEEFFYDCPDTNEAIKELGSPEKFAKQIIADYTLRSMEVDRKQKKKRDTFKDFIMVGLGLLALPISIPLLIAFGALIFALFMVLLSLVLAFGSLVLALFLAGIGVIIVGITAITSSFMSFVAMLGVGLMLVGGAMIVYALTYALVKNGIPRVSNGIGKLFRMIKGEKKSYESNY